MLVRSVFSLCWFGQSVHCVGSVSLFTVSVRSVCSQCWFGQSVQCVGSVSLYTVLVRSVCSMCRFGQSVHCVGSVSLFTVLVRSVCSMCRFVQSVQTALYVQLVLTVWRHTDEICPVLAEVTGSGDLSCHLSGLQTLREELMSSWPEDKLTVDHPLILILDKVSCSSFTYRCCVIKSAGHFLLCARGCCVLLVVVCTRHVADITAGYMYDVMCSLL